MSSCWPGVDTAGPSPAVLLPWFRGDEAVLECYNRPATGTVGEALHAVLLRHGLSRFALTDRPGVALCPT